MHSVDLPKSKVGAKIGLESSAMHLPDKPLKSLEVGQEGLPPTPPWWVLIYNFRDSWGRKKRPFCLTNMFGKQKGRPPKPHQRRRRTESSRNLNQSINQSTLTDLNGGRYSLTRHKFTSRLYINWDRRTQSRPFQIAKCELLKLL